MIFSMTKLKVRKKYIKNVVNNLFLNLNINKYPINMIAIINSFNNMQVVSYKNFKNKYNLTTEEVLSYLLSEDGCALYSPQKDKYVIYYNDLEGYPKVPGRIKWTLAHELGHVLLNHHSNERTKLFRQNGLLDNEYDWMEAEANRFASLLLANPIILDSLNIQSSTDIKNICGLSTEASKYRYKDYLKWSKNKLISVNDRKVFSQFSDFINKKACSICGNGFVIKNAKYCPICGTKNITWGDGKMIYKQIELNEKHKTRICPECQNENTNIDGPFCQICGTHIMNECTNLGCGGTLDGDARFCPFCGSKSTFLEDKILLSWKEEKSEIDDFLGNDSDYTDDEMPF